MNTSLKKLVKSEMRGVIRFGYDKAVPPQHFKMKLFQMMVRMPEQRQGAQTE